MLSLLPPAYETEHTKDARVIGGGSHAKVYAGMYPRVNVGRVAFKIPRIGSEKAIKRELQALERLGNGHKHIVRLLDSFPVGDGIGLVLELFDTDMFAEVAKCGPLPCKRVSSVAWQICSALSFIHETGLVLCDLKTENVLLRRTSGGDHVALADFGLAHQIGVQIDAFIGSPTYSAPETLVPGTVSPARDVWAFGVTLFALLSARGAFDRGNVLDTHQAIRNDAVPLGSLPVGTSAEAKALVVRVLNKSPENRPAASELMESDLFVVAGAPH
jgi:serine/threonine protein kinase